MKILYITSTFPNSEEDPEPRFVLDLAKNVNQQLSDPNLLVLTPACKDFRGHHVISGVDVFFYPYLPSNNWENLTHPGAILPKLEHSIINWLKVPCLLLSLYFHTIKFMRKMQPDIVHTHWLIPQGIMIAFLPFKTKYFMTAHAADIFTFNFPVIKTIKRLAISKCSHVFTASHEGKQFLKENVCPCSNPSVITQGFDPLKFKPSEEKLKKLEIVPQKNSKPTNPIKLSFVGRLSEKKGVFNLIEAVNSILKQNPSLNFHVSIIGRGEEDFEEDLKTLISKEHLDGFITLKGAKSHAELGDFLGNQDILVVPSIVSASGDKDAAPTVLLEGMACGCAIVASNIGEISEIVKPDENALIVESDRIPELSIALGKLIQNPLQLHQFQKSSLNHAKQFTWENVTKNVISQYKN